MYMYVQHYAMIVGVPVAVHGVQLAIELTSYQSGCARARAGPAGSEDRDAYAIVDRISGLPDRIRVDVDRSTRSRSCERAALARARELRAIAIDNNSRSRYKRVRARINARVALRIHDQLIMKLAIDRARRHSH